MTMSNRRVYGGLYTDRDAAERGIRRFHEAGYEPNRIGIIARDRDEAGKLAEETGAGVAKGAATGAVAGGILGGLAGLLVGTGALAIPGIGPVVAAGTLATVLGSTAAGAGIGAAAGGLIGALVGLGIPEEDAQFYAEGVKRGGVLVTVQTNDDRAQDALDIMRRANAVDVDTQRNAWRSSGWNRFDDRNLPTSDYPTFSDRSRMS